MPELPEVEVICRGLRPHLIGRKIESISHNGKQLRQPVPLSQLRTYLIEKTVSKVERRAKYLLVYFGEETILIIHLGMTGNLGVFPTGSPTAIHDHLQVFLDNNMELRYNDTRRFGSIHIFVDTTNETLEETFFQRTGPEPLGESCTASYLRKKAKAKSIPIKSFLMNAEIIAGVGNIYANETLYVTKMKPSRPAGSITGKEWDLLLTNLKKTLNWAIDCGGSTISDFINASGESGYFQANFKVYGRNGEPCPHCSTTIEKTQIGGRASFFCPQCQKK